MVLGDSTQEPYLKGKTEIISKLRNLRNVDQIVSRKGLRAGSKESGSANPEKKVRGAEEGEADQKEPGIRVVGHNTVVGRDGVSVWGAHRNQLVLGLSHLVKVKAMDFTAMSRFCWETGNS